MKHIKQILIAISVAALLVACSGGGGDATAPEETSTGGTAGSTPTDSAATEPTTGYGYVTNPAGGNFGLNCIKDYSNGLIWEGKEPANSSLRFYGRKYTNFDSVTEYQKDTAFGLVRPTQVEVDASTNSVGYKNAVNATALCGFSDWRIPSFEELQTLANGFAGSLPSINTTWFPSTVSDTYLTSSKISPANHNEIKTFSFETGASGGSYRRIYTHHLRLVRSSR